MRLKTPARLALALSSWCTCAPVSAAAETRGLQAADGGDAAAQPGEQGQFKIAVLPIAAGEQIDEAAREDFFRALHRGVGRGDFELVDEEAVAALARRGCKDDGECSDKALAELRETGATHYVRTRVDRESRDYAIKLELVDLADGAVIVESEQTCEICGLGEVSSQLESQGAFIQARLSSSQEGPPVLVVKSDPSGALVFLDDKLVGQTPFERDVVSGTHTLRVSLNGYVGQERDVTLETGRRELVELKLERVPADPKLRIVGAALVGGGLAFFGGGVVLLALDGQPFQGRCTGADVDPMGNCRFLLNTKLGGAVAAVSGAVVATVGVMMLIRHRKSKAPKGELRAGITPNGVVLRARF